MRLMFCMFGLIPNETYSCDLIHCLISHIGTINNVIYFDTHRGTLSNHSTLPSQQSLSTSIVEFVFAEGDHTFISQSTVSRVCVHHLSTRVVHILYTIKSKSLEKEKNSRWKFYPSML